MNPDLTQQKTAPMLRIVSGPAYGRLYPLDGERVVIGRVNGCDIVLPPLYVSKRHAAIVRRRDGYYLEDLDSTAGTFVGNRKLTEGGPPGGWSHLPRLRLRLRLPREPGPDLRRRGHLDDPRQPRRRCIGLEATEHRSRAEASRLADHRPQPRPGTPARRGARPHPRRPVQDLSPGGCAGRCS